MKKFLGIFIILGLLTACTAAAIWLWETRLAIRQVGEWEVVYKVKQNPAGEFPSQFENIIKMPEVVRALRWEDVEGGYRLYDWRKGQWIHNGTLFRDYSEVWKWISIAVIVAGTSIFFAYQALTWLAEQRRLGLRK